MFVLITGKCKHTRDSRVYLFLRQTINIQQKRKWKTNPTPIVSTANFSSLRETNIESVSKEKINKELIIYDTRRNGREKKFVFKKVFSFVLVWQERKSIWFLLLSERGAPRRPLTEWGSRKLFFIVVYEQ